HVTVRDAEDVVRGSLLASVLFLAAMVFLHPDGLHGFPRAVFLLDLVLCTALMGGARLAIRLAREQRGRRAVRRVETLALIGAAGSIGSELCRHLSACEPERLVLYDRHENGLFALEMEFRARFPDVRLEPVLGDVLLEDQLRSVFAAHRPDLVFHAAAYKHVPMAERNVLEAARNNIIGTS